MATPKINKKYEARKQKAKELIAAGGCVALKYWNNTDALRLCPEDHKKHVSFEPEGMVYISEWLEAARKAIELINEGIALVEKPTPFPSPDREVGGLRWVRAIDRLPQLPDPLPADTPDERGILFVCRRHSAARFWYPSYGQKAEDHYPLEKDVDRRVYDEGWGREEWEWLDESPSLPADKPDTEEVLVQAISRAYHEGQMGGRIQDVYAEFLKDKPESPESFKKWLEDNCDPHKESKPIGVEEDIFATVKSAVGTILWNKLTMSKDGKAIEGNPAAHQIAEYIVHNFLPIVPESESAIVDAFFKGADRMKKSIEEELCSLRSQLQSLTEERDTIKQAYELQRVELEKAQERGDMWKEQYDRAFGAATKNIDQQ